MRDRYSFNEGKACDAVIRHLEAREGAQRQGWQPIEEHAASPVEMICNIGNQLFAFEHTGIEPFEGHVQLQAEADRHFEPIRTAFADIMPATEVYELHMPVKAMQGMKKAEIHKIQEAIIAWVKNTVPALPIKPYCDYTAGMQPVKLPDVPFEISCFRFTNPIPPGRFQIRHIVEQDSGQTRIERIRRACEDKFPKLAAWKKDKGARTVLILEDNDIQLTNPERVAETYLPLALASTERPDETYMVTSCVKPWWMAPILIDDISYFDFGKSGKPTNWEIDMEKLVQLTKR